MKSSQIILITGTSSGFGLLTAAHLANRGHRVIATMRDLNKKNALVNELNKNEGGKVEILRLDVTNKDSIKKAFENIAKMYGYIDVLVNNAGFGIGGCFEDLTDEEIRSVMDTNFFGVQNVIRQALPMMRSRRKGKIINISSVSGFSTSPCFSAYNASKWALEGFSESLSYELKHFGIDVYLIEPGTYKTKIFGENARYAKNFDNKVSPYYNISSHLKKKVMNYVKDCFKDPHEVAYLIEKIISSKKSRFRNIPDIESRVLYALRRILPFSIYRRMIHSVLFKDFKNNF